MWGRGLRFDLTLEGRAERQRPISNSSERRAFGDVAPSFEVGPTIVYDRRDHPIHPTRGFYLTAGLDFLGSQNQTQNIGISYRETLSAQWVGGWFKRRLLLVPSLKLGAVQSVLSNDQLTASRSDFLFIAGGDRVSYPVRGYPIGAINTCQIKELQRGRCGESYLEVAPTTSDLLNFSGRALINMSIESRVSSLIIPNLWLAAFSDVGAVSEGISDFTLESFYPSVGVGVRYLFYGQVPLRFDIAYPLRATFLSAQEPNYIFDFFYTF
jgi:outer membrane protein assembly factor BamA